MIQFKWNYLEFRKGDYMSSTFAISNLLFEELYLAVRSTNKLINKVQVKDWEYRPQENMRSLLELTNHLAQIPFIDLAIMQEKSGAEVDKLQTSHLFTSEPSKLIRVMEEGYQALKNYIVSMSENDFLEKQTKAFYFEADSKGYTQAKWLIEITTHTFHHRGQFFNYLKQLGYEVNMFDLY
jgi:uncharacterized damage-inducible protein DinB